MAPLAVIQQTEHYWSTLESKTSIMVIEAISGTMYPSLRLLHKLSLYMELPMPMIPVWIQTGPVMTLVLRLPQSMLHACLPLIVKAGSVDILA